MTRLQKKRLTNMIGTIFRVAVLLGVSYVIIQPMMTRLATSFMQVEELYDQSVKWIARNPTLNNYRTCWVYMNYPQALFNSLTLAIVVSVCQLASCTYIGYGLARFQWRGSGLLLSLAIFTLVVPPQMIRIPLYLNFRYFDLFGILKSQPLNLVGTYWPFILTGLTGSGFRNGLFIYIMRQFFRGMPRELEEAAYVDGCGFLSTFFRVMLPSAVPGLIVVFLFSFVWQWNDYFYTTMFMSTKNFLPQALETVASKAAQVIRATDMVAVTSGMVQDNFNTVINNAGMIMVITPLLIIYLFMQRYFVESIERTGLVG
ncbi:MAG TPA: carbohydrate ABC transporter permease [Limnochordia bacterium]|jgi:multiple sugar transport system permease protein|nr:carbohydrate ABC transporter permease [Bacillota bacterium]HKM18112.1 carbohydrate ABC transporter permease [Limnochordia bacterium]